jgi:hypothetical protein
LDPSDLAHLVVEAQLRVPAHLVVVVLPLALADLVQEARLPALAHAVVEAQLLQLLRSQSFSASTARNSVPPVQPTYERAPSTR